MPAVLPGWTSSAAPRRRPSAPTGVFAQPIRSPDFGQAQARKQTQKAGNALPPDPRVPEFPDMRFSPQQRQVVRRRTVSAVQKIAQQRGENPADTARRLYDEGGPQTRTALHLFGRAVAEDQASAYRRTSGHSTGSVEGDSRAFTALGLRSEAQPGPHHSALYNAGAATYGFLKAPDRNLFVAAAPGFEKTVGPFVRDTIDLPRNTVLSGYLTGKALVSAAGGNAKPLQQLGTSIKNSDPIALAVQGRWNEAALALHAHPVSTALELGGVRGLLRGAGRVAGVGTTREAAALPGTALEHAREYSPNPLAKPFQVATEKSRTKRATALRNEADHLDHAGSPEAADAKRIEAAQLDPRVMSEAQVAHRGDVRESMGQPMRRRGRTQVMAEMKPTYVRPREGGHLQRLAVEGSIPVRRVDEHGAFDPIHGQISIPHMREDIAAKLDRLKAEHAALPPRLQRLNSRTQRHLSDLQGKTDAQLLNVAHKALDVSGITNRVEADVIGRKLLDPQEARIARLKTYAFEHMGASVGRATEDRRPQLLSRDGQPVPPDAIEAHMRAHGVDPNTVSFVTQRPLGSLGAYNLSWRTAKGATTKTRTGGAILKGLVDTHPRNLTANAVRLQQLHAANANWERGLAEVAQRSAGKVHSYGTKDAAQSVAGEIEARTGMKWRPVQMIPWGGREAQLQHMLDHADAEGYVHGGKDHPISRAVEEAVKEHASGPGPWALVPDTWARRIEDHAQVYRSAHPAMRAINSMFRMTVLPTSLSWLLGNTAEATLRAGVQSPRIAHNISTYRRVIGKLEQVDPEEAAHMKDLLGVGHFGSMEQSNVFTSAAQFSNTRFRRVAEALHTLRAAPGPGTLASAYRAYTHFVFEHVNSQLERPLREAMAGHHIRMKLLDSSRVVRNSSQAIEDAANGLRNTTAQVRLADDVRRAYGQYEAWNPEMRRAALLYTPFLPWAVNAMRFLYGVLPKDHPILTAAIAAAYTATQDYRKIHGLDEWTKGHVPSFLLGSIPTPGGGHLRIARYTPFGFAGDPTGTLASQALPQFSGVLDAFNGRDWKGKDLKNSDGTPFTTDQKISYAGGQFAQSVVPLLNLVTRTAAAPGSSPVQKLAYVENPLKAVKGKQKPGSKPFDFATAKGHTLTGSFDFSTAK